MKLSLTGKKEDVLYVANLLVSLDTNLPLIMIITADSFEDYCVQIVTDTSLDVIAKTKDLAF